MNTKHNFFNKHAEEWDSHLKQKDFDAIELMLERAQVTKDDHVLDVGAGTGVLVSFLKKRGVIHYQAVEASSGMASVFKRKYPEEKIIISEFETANLNKNAFDKILVFNTFPHFADYELVFRNAYSFLKKNGLLVISHSMNRQELNNFHAKVGRAVSRDMLPEDESMKKFFAMAGFQDIIIENTTWYFASGRKV